MGDRHAGFTRRDSPVSLIEPQVFAWSFVDADPPLEEIYDEDELRKFIGLDDDDVVAVPIDFDKEPRFNPHHDKLGKFSHGSSNAVGTAKKKVRRIPAPVVDPVEFGKRNKPKLTAEQASAITAFTEQAHKPINSALRNGTDLSTRDSDNLGHIGDAMNNNVIGENVMVTRHTSPAAFRGMRMSSLAGRTVVDHGFVSTSLTDDPIYDTQDSVKMSIRVPKGTRGMFIGMQSVEREEFEVLLDSGTKFNILSSKKEGDKWLVEAQVLH